MQPIFFIPFHTVASFNEILLSISFRIKHPFSKVFSIRLLSYGNPFPWTNSESGQIFRPARSLRPLPRLTKPPRCIQDSPRHNHRGLWESDVWSWPVGRFLVTPSLVGFWEPLASDDVLLACLIEHPLLIHTPLPPPHLFLH